MVGKFCPPVGIGLDYLPKSGGFDRPPALRPGPLGSYVLLVLRPCGPLAAHGWDIGGHFVILMYPDESKIKVCMTT